MEAEEVSRHFQYTFQKTKIFKILSMSDFDHWFVNKNRKVFNV